MHSRIALFLTLLAFLISACASSKGNTSPTLAAITMLPESDQGQDPQFESSSGGEPRSSGYWLVWNTCAENNQSEIAQANGGREAGWILMDDLLADPGILIGTLEVITCQQGINLLYGLDLHGVNRGNDAAYVLAVQLLAAQLNLSVGSEYCPASDQAMSEAQLLLLELDFDGTGGYLGPPLASQEMDKAKSLTEQLESYNTGALCVP